MLHGNALLLTCKPSTGPDRTQRPKRQPKAPKGDAQKWPKGKRRVLEIIGPERLSRKTELQDMERTTSVAHGDTEGAAKHAT